MHMQEGMKSAYQILFYFTFVFFISGPVAVAQIPDLSSLNIDDLSDAQLQSLLQRASSEGYTESQLFDLAGSQGMSMTEISKLGQRVNQINSDRVSTADGRPSGERVRTYLELEESVRAVPSTIFGLDIFRSGNGVSQFGVVQNIPTPNDYKLGPGDEIYIDIYGKSEQYYQAIISSDGLVILENIGPIALSGLTIANAESLIKKKLSKVYDGLAGTNTGTNLTVTLGQVRSIQVTIVGQVNAPGTYTLSGLSSAFNALYMAGGVTENGTLRDIRIHRNSRLIKSIDLYDFIINGESNNNIRLEHNDVIIVGPYTNRVSISGAIKVPGVFEATGNESLTDLLKYAGGFSEDAFTAAIKVTRNKAGEKHVADIFEDQFNMFYLKPGDFFEVGKVLNRYANRVTIVGAVYRPGNYALGQGMTVKQLLEKSQGLQGDAFMQRAIITRTDKDLGVKMISLNLQDVINGKVPDIDLSREDVLTIYSTHDLVEERYVEISGEVNKAGIYAFSKDMTVKDLLMKAGGFSGAATGNRAEIIRRNATEGGFSSDLSEIFVVDLSKELSDSTNTFNSILYPFDHLTIRRNPNFHVQEFAYVEGQVLYPGRYAITNYREKISDLLSRSGGITDFAYIEGATLLRKTEFFDNPTDLDKRVTDLELLLERMRETPESLNESERLYSNRIVSELDVLYTGQASNQSLSNYAKKERLKEILQRNTLFGKVELKQSEAIGINLKEIIESPGSKYDLILEEGDVLIIPKVNQTVRLRGKVLYPTTVRFEQNKSLRYFINSSGGFDNRAKRKGTYVIYANGEVARTKGFLFFRDYPNAAPGAEIIVPTKLPKIPFQTSDLLGIASAIASIALVVTQITF
ncbi:MAG: protein involved in polysaccharide export with SLBB domain [Parvicella sp.]|jgi:protein involved in polysaccharide export with SLBB domain